MRKTWVTDLMSGITVGIVALPLALAFGIASGAGAAAGLYTAIVAGLLAGVCGGSRYQITGPTGAMTVVLVGVVAEHGVPGMLVAGLLAGIIQLALGLLRLGKLIKLIPHDVVAGFTNGIAIVIFLGQVKNLQNGPLVALITIAAIVLTKRTLPRMPASLVGLLAGTAFHWITQSAGPTVIAIPASLPGLAFPALSIPMLFSLIKPAVEIAMLGSIESLLSAAVADNMTGTVHDSNRELIGQGIGNIAAAMVGGVPATGAIARTAVNIKSGGQSRLVSVVHSLLLLAVLLFLGPWTSYIPLAGLSGILAVTCYNMIDRESLQMMRLAPRSYSLVLLVTTAATVFTDLTLAVAIGVLLSVVVHTFERGKLRLHEVHDSRLPSGVQVYRVEGPIFFGNTQQIEAVDRLPAKAVLLDLQFLHSLDVSGTLALQKLAERFHSAGKQLVLYGTGLEVRQMLQNLSKASFVERHVAESLDHALERVQVAEVAS